MAKRLNYTIGINADISKFEASLKEAFLALEALSSKPQMVTGLQEASTAAADLSKNLQSAVNVNTGKLDLSVFNNNLKASGQTLESYYDQLSQLGPIGTEAFLSVATAITSAELPLRRTNTLMDSLWVTMKNTMRWQITSSALQGFVGSLQTAYGYSKSLDASLNNIRIVSEKSADDMKEFAEYANKAAKALSATTTDYTNASLIYYQQGLNDEEVLARTDTTIKMANVAGQTAETVSDQMTAVWNNFYDGSKSIEYYADVMVKLGAATASSTDEIAEGLEKFAAIADTVGLSYEYAAAALATVTATTRQSADVVGTAFKTIFARIQDLELGETLDDGTTLGTYSQALEAVGINILDANGNLRDMDDLLNEMGAKWDTINKSQQVALAEAVAGVRQYNQLIALMDNWDFFEENLDTAYGAEGELDKQAAIYAESWEAARDRVTAAAEDIYDSLVNPDLFIGLDNIFTPLLSGTADVIDAMGGMKGILVTSISLLNSVYGDKIAQSMRDIASQVGFITNQEQLRARTLQEQAAVLSKNIQIEQLGVEGPRRESLNILQQQLELQGLVNSKIDGLNERQKAVLQQDLNHLKSLQQQSDEYVQQIELADTLVNKTKQQIKQNVTTDNKADISKYLGGLQGSASRTNNTSMQKAVKEAQELTSNSKSADQAISRLITRLETISKKQVGIQAISTRMKQLGADGDQVTNEMRQLAIELGGVNKEATDEQVVKYFDSINVELQSLKDQAAVLTKTLEHFMPEDQVNLVVRFTSAIKEGKSATEALKYATEEYDKTNRKVSEGLRTNAYATKDWADTIVNVGSKLSQLAMSIQSIKNLGNVFQDSDMDTGERLISIFTSLGMLLPEIISLTSALGVATNLVTISATNEVTVNAAGITGKLAKAAANKILAKTEGTVAAATGAANAAFVAQLITLAPYIAAIAAIGVVIYALVKAYNADADAAKEAATGVEALTTNYEEAKTAASELKDTISNWDDAIASLEDLEQGTEEYAEALKEANSQAKDLIETYGLWNDYSYDSNGAIKFNDGVLEGLQAQADQRERDAESALYAGKIYANNADIKSETTNTKRDIGSIVNVNYSDGSYNRQLTDSEINSAIDLLKSNEENNTPVSDEQLVAQLRELIPGLMLSVDGLEDFRSSLEGLSNSMDEAQEANEYYAKELLKNNLEETRGEAISDIAGGNEALQEQLLNTYAAREAQVLEEQDKALSNLTVNESNYKNNNAVEKYTGWTIDNDEGLARLYAEKVLGRTDVDDLSYKGGNNKGNLQDSEGNLIFEESMSDDYMRKMIAYAYAQEQLMASLTESSEAFDQEAYEESLRQVVEGATSLGEAFGGADFTTAILNSLADNGESIDLSSLFAELSPDDITQLIGMSEDELYAALGLTDEDLAALGIDNATAWYNGFIDSLDSYDPSEYYDRINKAASSGESSARSLIESIQSGDTTYENISENEDYTNLLSQLDNIIDEYPELQAAQIELSKTWEVGTQKFAEALEQVQDKLAEIKLNDLMKQAADARDELKDFLGEDDWEVAIEADPEGFNNTIDKILDAEYAIDIEIHSQAEQEFESISNAMSNIEDQASKIGENFVISANDIRELNNTFPGIIQGMQDIGDGSVQLNQQVVENAIAAAKGEIAADGEATITKLENQAKLLRSKQQVYQQMADAALVLAQGEVATDEQASEAQATLSAGLSDLEQLNSEAATTVKTENQEITADSAYDNGLVTAENWDSAFSSAAESSANFARAAIANMKAVADQNEGAITTGNFAVNYSGSSGVSAEAATLQETQDMLDAADTVSEEAWAELAAKYQNLADSAGASANDIEGMIAQIGASTTELDNLLNNIGSGKGSGGGSGGGSGKTLDKEDLKTLEEVEDRYHQINRQLERQSDLLDDIDTATDRAYGKDKLAKFQEGIEALEQEQELLNRKLEEAEGYLYGTDNYEGDLARVQKYFDNVQLDDNGEITNYEELLRLNMEMYNAEVEKYNLAVAGKTLTDEEAEALKAQLEVAKTLYETRLAALEQYEATLDEIREITDSIEENARSIADKKLEEIKYKLEIVLDVKSMYDSLRDLEKEIAESFGDALTHGLQSAKLSAEAAKAEAALLPDYQSQYAELKALYESTTDDADRQAIMEEIQDLQGKIIDSASALVEWANSIEDIVPDAVNAAAERFAAFTDQLEHNTTVLDTIKELYALQGVTYKTMDDFNRLQKVSQEKLEAQVASAVLQKSWYEEAKAHLEEAQTKLDSLNGDETDIRYDAYKKARDAYLEEFNEAQEAYLSSAKEAMETAQEMYLQEIEKAVYEFGQAISNGVGLDLLQEQYDHYIEENERYLDTVNEAYEVASWYNKLQKDIDESTNSAQTERLKALQKEIEARRENNTLSEYDLEILEAKYNVLQAQMALEDAQNAKNNLQLVRDSQGNWNYQYTADQDKIADAEQGLLDAQNDWYNIAKDQVTNITGEIVAMWKECQDKVKEIYTDDNLTYEEKLAAAEEVQRYYSEKAKYLEEEKNVAIKDMNEAGSEALIEIADQTGALITKDIKQVGIDYAWNMGQIYEVTDEFFNQQLTELLDTAKSNLDSYNDTVSNVADETGTSLGELDEITNQVSDSTDELRESGLDAADALWDQIDAAQNASDEYLDLADSIWEAVYAMQALAAEQASYAASQAGVSSGTYSGKGYDANTDYSGVIMDGIANGWLQYGSSAYNELFEQRENKIDGEGLSEDYYISRGDEADDRFSGAGSVNQYDSEEEWRDKLHDLGISGFATGGYTGTFDDARLAFLHEKELVLNQEDTANILAAVHAVRDFGPNLLESIEKALDNNVIAAMALMGAKLTTSMVTPQSDVLEQTVHIDKVEFPNVTSRTEIEEAFVSLTNDAAQWARRRK